MDPREVEFTSLVGWLRTFALQSEASTAAQLSDGLAMAEALVQIEPAVFSPSWFAGVLKSENTNNDTLNTILNMLLHYYSDNLSGVCVSGDLPVPDIPVGCQELSSLMVARFLKLMLGVAVTCSNKLLFISKIQSLDETTQHALTACVASFIYTTEWAGRVPIESSSTEQKMPTPPGDEIWAQKCHELDFQVALLKEERSNLMNENEELYGKVKAAQTVSRKDSVKSRQFEGEIAHFKDEVERLRLACEGTRIHVDNMEIRLKCEDKSQGEINKLAEETDLLKEEIAKIKADLNAKENGSKWGGGEVAVLQRIEEQQEMISEIRSMVEYQAGLGREVECLKDQVDVLREQAHKSNKYEQELADIKTRIQDFQLQNDGMAKFVKNHQNPPLMSLGSETCLDSPETSLYLADSDHPEPSSVSNSVLYVSQSNNMLEETIVMPVQVENVQKEDLNSSTNYPMMKEELRFVQAVPEDNVTTENHSSKNNPAQTTSRDSESNSQQLGDSQIEDDFQASPRKLEMLKEEQSYRSSSSPESEPTHEAVEHLLRVISDPNLDIQLEDIEDALDTGRIVNKSKENFEDANEEFSQASDLMEKPPGQLFDPNDPKVKELEEWNCSMDRSMVDEVTPRGRMKNVFKLKKMSKSREKNLLAEKFGLDDDDEDQEKRGATVDCFSSWMLQAFVKVFD